MGSVTCARLSVKFLVLFLVLSLLAIAGYAAETTATLGGTVKDSTGAVVPNATLTLTNTETGVSRALSSNQDGTYLFTLVPVGTYKVSVEKQGFRKYVQSGIILLVNQNGKLDVSLQVGAQDQVVEVTANVAQVDTTGATLGAVETSRRIVDLPLVERDTLQLGLLQAGVFTPDPDDGSGNPFNVSGQRSESLTFLVDGVDNTDFLSNNFVVDPNPDAVEEFKILTNNYGAEFGRTSGGIVNQVIKSGTNAYHGNVFDFFRNDALNARNYFQLERSVFKRNIFGGTIGGPIKKDKLFFFLSYQGARRIEGVQVPQQQVLSAAERTGNFDELLTGTQASPCQNPGPGDPTFDLGQLFNPLGPTAQVVCSNPITPGGAPQVVTLQTPYGCTTPGPCATANNIIPVNPVIANYIANYLPLPNVPGTNLFTASPAGRIQEDQGIARVDYHITDHDTLSGSYIINDHRDALPLQVVKGASTGGSVPNGSGLTDAFRTQQGSITYTHVFTPNVINEFIFGANRNAQLNAVPTTTTSPAQLGFQNVNPDDAAGTAPPIMFTNTFSLGPSPQGPTTIHDVTFHWQDSVSWTKGHHNMKFGGDARRVRNNFNFDFFNNGSFDFANFLSPFTGNGLADFVAGFPDNYFQFSNAVYGIRATQLDLYAQDSWKITPRLTLDFGLRWEYNSPLSDPHNEIIGFFPGKQSTVFPDAPNSLLYPGDPGTPNNAMTAADLNNFAPRFGFAWDVLGTGKLVMRGGYGIFYDIEDGALNEQFGGQAPFGSVTNLNYFGFAPGGADPIADPFNAFNPGTLNPYPFAANGRTGTFFVPKVSFAFVVDPNFRTPYSQNFNFGFQYQLTRDTLVEAYYVGSIGRKTITSADVNFPQPNILMQQFNNFGFTNPDCARPLAGCANPADPNSSLTEAGQLLTDHSNGNSDSHEFQLTVDKRFSHGFNIRGAYTFGKTIDEESGFRSRSSLQTNPFDLAFDRGLADFDVTHRLVISGFWEVPFQEVFRSDNGFARALTHGWQFGGIASFQTGTPFTIFSNDNQSQQGSGLDRADLVGTQQTFDPRTLRTFSPSAGPQGSCLNGPTTGNFYFNPMAYDCAFIPLFTFGDSGRNTIRGPGFANFDLSIIKNFKVRESMNVQFRTEFFNAFNHAQFLNPNAFGFTGSFGQVTQARDPRIIQFALKFSF